LRSARRRETCRELIISRERSVGRTWIAEGIC